MEAFGLLKFWRNAGGEVIATGGKRDSDAEVANISAGANSVGHQAVDTEHETDEEESFFDLEFTAAVCDEKEEDEARHVDIKSRKIDEDTYHDSPEKAGENSLNCIKSPKDVFLKGKIVPLEPSSKPQSPISLLRSAPKFRVFMLGFKKPKLEKSEKHQQQKSAQGEQSKRFTVKCKVEEVPIASLFTRDNSLRSKLVKQGSEDASSDDPSKRFPKDAVQKYLKLIKPLYVWASKRYNEKVNFPEPPSSGTPLSSPSTASVFSPRKQTEERRGNRQTALRMVCKHLGKSRSASSAVGIIPSPARRDDSLLEQHDGIQSAILHCKRSFNSSRDFSIYSRSTSDLLHDKPISPSRKSLEEKRSSI